MTVLTLNALSQRIRDVLEANFDTHKTAIASDIDPIRSLESGPVKSRPATLAVAVFYEDSEEKSDSPQETGEDRVLLYRLEAVQEIARFDEAGTKKVEDAASALDYTLKKEQEMLDPDTGTKLPWLFKVWPAKVSIQYRQGGRKVAGVISITIRATVHEAESY